MKKELKKITDLTINELLNKEIILPSVYFEKFNYFAANLEVDLEDEEFEKEINQLIVEDYLNIENFMKSVMTNVQTLTQCSLEAKNAILEKDVEGLNNVHKKMVLLEKELETLNSKIYADEITNTYNRKWIYNQFLNENNKFVDNGALILIDINDYNYILTSYKELIANNLLIFIVNFISNTLKNEDFKFNIARFSENKFMIFIKNESCESIKNIVLNMKQVLSNTTLKSNSGLLIKANYNFSLINYKKDQESKDIFESLFNQLKD